MTWECLEVDKLAAHRLLTRLGLEATEQHIALVGQEFATHRITACEGIVGRAQRRIIDVLEATSIETLASRSVNEDWAQGFAAAEEAVALLEVDELIDTVPDVQFSKGQILRMMIRSARNAGRVAP